MCQCRAQLSAEETPVSRGTQGGGPAAFVVSYSVTALLCFDGFPRNRQGRRNSSGGVGQPLMRNLQDKIWIKGFLWADKWTATHTHTCLPYLKSLFHKLPASVSAKKKLAQKQLFIIMLTQCLFDTFKNIKCGYWNSFKFVRMTSWCQPFYVCACVCVHLSCL